MLIEKFATAIAIPTLVLAVALSGCASTVPT